MIHIIFGAAAGGSLKVALRKMRLDQTEKIISFWDIFSIGPVWKLDQAIGVTNRWEWLGSNMTDSYNDHPKYTQHFERALKLINEIKEGEQIIVWTAENAHEQIGLRFVISLLRNKNADISLINTTKVHEKLTKGNEIRYTFLHTGEIGPEEMERIYQDGGKTLLSNEKRTILERDWLAIADSIGTLRIWENGEIKSVAENYYDAFIMDKAKLLQAAHRNFIIVPRLIAEAVANLDDYIGDTFIEYRLRKLIEAGIFEMEGSLESMRLYKVRLR